MNTKTSGSNKMRAVAADQLRIMTDECLQTRFCVWIFLNAGAETHPDEVHDIHEAWKFNIELQDGGFEDAVPFQFFLRFLGSSH